MNTYPSKERRDRRNNPWRQVIRAVDDILLELDRQDERDKKILGWLVLAFIVVLGAWFLKSQFLKVEAAEVYPRNSFLEHHQVQKDLSSYRQQEEVVREICQGYL